MFHLNEDIRAYDTDLMVFINKILGGDEEAAADEIVRYSSYHDSVGIFVEEVETKHVAYHDTQPVYFRAYRVFRNGSLDRGDSHLSVSLKP